MDSFVTYILEQLEPLEVYERPMFGGYGLYLGERFFGIIHDGELFFKTDENSRQEYGTQPFSPTHDQTLKNYWQVPAHVLEDADTLQEWAVQAAKK